MTIGQRVVVAATCRKCGALTPGSEFDRRPRNPGEPPYIDQRCKRCRWHNMEESEQR